MLLSGCAWSTIASVDGDGGKANGQSSEPSVSSDGRYVAFSSYATDLVPDDNNGQPDIFVRDLRAGITRRVNVDVAGGDADSSSFEPSISADGRYVAFTSNASDLVEGDGNARFDVFVRDLVAGTTTRATVDTTGGDPDSGILDHISLSANGRFVAFRSLAADLVAGDSNAKVDVFVRDLQAGTTARASVDAAGGDGNDHSLAPSVSADGRFVVFNSLASDLVAGDTNGRPDVFVRDLQAGMTTKVTTGAFGVYEGARPEISADGRFVVFAGTDLEGVFVYDRETGTTALASVGTPQSSQPSISADGRFVAYNSYSPELEGPTIYVRDRLSSTTASVASSGSYLLSDLAPRISGDGRSVAFADKLDNVIGVGGASVFDVVVRSTTVPTISSASPSTLVPGSTATVAVSGTNFLPGASASITGGVVVSQATRLSDTSLELLVSVPADAAPGLLLLLVSIPQTGPGPAALSTGVCSCVTIN